MFVSLLNVSHHDVTPLPTSLTSAAQSHLHQHCLQNLTVTITITTSHCLMSLLCHVTCSWAYLTCHITTLRHYRPTDPSLTSAVQSHLHQHCLQLRSRLLRYCLWVAIMSCSHYYSQFTISRHLLIASLTDVHYGTTDNTHNFTAFVFLCFSQAQKTYLPNGIIAMQKCKYCSLERVAKQCMPLETPRTVHCRCLWTR